ncbi:MULTISPECIES: DUF2892 domain-containing protein [unclassified Pseudomonas]|uniref:YgaP family membrane protein n=1 Tax=unclassified Pseudomonas TaxID=196821 RepID=UPI000C88E56E|nr:MULTISPECIES: DUF2892 domain-containing protein [unclassified Pseudomonas]PMZ87079.1 DUF2892 domain-containing protein [Pseudomonas sp. FW215-T2]PNA13455.1 DUF2892 domain-containing protein [Pseudomonas sp. FW215-R3]PNB38131.1 DUF2892 domain-containing protein [Pseudomonas sp. FW305-131]
MKTNTGTIDRSLRIVTGLGLSLPGVIGFWAWIGLVPLDTGIFRFYPPGFSS